jgi:hypothetical protein
MRSQKPEVSDIIKVFDSASEVFGFTFSIAITS